MDSSLIMLEIPFNQKIVCFPILELERNQFRLLRLESFKELAQTLNDWLSENTFLTDEQYELQIELQLAQKKFEIENKTICSSIHHINHNDIPQNPLYSQRLVNYSDHIKDADLFSSDGNSIFYDFANQKDPSGQHSFYMHNDCHSQADPSTKSINTIKFNNSTSFP